MPGWPGGDACWELQLGAAPARAQRFGGLAPGLASMCTVEGLADLGRDGGGLDLQRYSSRLPPGRRDGARPPPAMRGEADVSGEAGSMCPCPAMWSQCGISSGCHAGRELYSSPQRKRRPWVGPWLMPWSSPMTASIRSKQPPGIEGVPGRAGEAAIENATEFALPGGQDFTQA